jgi:hypothetical protein
MQFKFTTGLLFAFLPSILALPEPIAKAAADAVRPSERDALVAASSFEGAEAPVSGRDEPGSLISRACAYDGCVSQVGASAGKYCGFCKQVLVRYTPTSIYQYEIQLSSSAQSLVQTQFSLIRSYPFVLLYLEQNAYTEL